MEVNGHLRASQLLADQHVRLDDERAQQVAVDARVKPRRLVDHLEPREHLLERHARRARHAAQERDELLPDEQGAPHVWQARLVRQQPVGAPGPAAVVEAVLRAGRGVQVDEHLEPELHRPVQHLLQRALHLRLPDPRLARLHVDQPVGDRDAHRVDARALEAHEVVVRDEALPVRREHLERAVGAQARVQRPLVHDEAGRRPVARRRLLARDRVRAVKIGGRDERLQHEPAAERDAADELPLRAHRLRKRPALPEVVEHAVRADGQRRGEEPEDEQEALPAPKHVQHRAARGRRVRRLLEQGLSPLTGRADRLIRMLLIPWRHRRGRAPASRIHPVRANEARRSARRARYATRESRERGQGRERTRRTRCATLRRPVGGSSHAVQGETWSRCRREVHAIIDHCPRAKGGRG